MNPAAAPRITVITVNFRTPDHAIACARAVAAQRGPATLLDMILIDNGSGDGSAEALEQGLADLVAEGFLTLVPLAINGGFGWANNQAMLRAFARPTPPDAVLLLNPDCAPEPGAIDALVDEMMAHPDCGATGSQLLNPDGSLTGSAFHFQTVGNEFVRGLGLPSVGRVLGIQPVFVPYGQAGPVGWLTGASVLLRAEALREVGLFDTGFFLYFEEVELMHRMARAGWQLCHVPQSRVMHIGGASTGLKEGKSLIAKAMPPYWYDSRRRFFALAYGPRAAYRASLAWLAGARLGRIAKRLMPGRDMPDTAADAAQMKAQGLRPLARDAVPAIAHIGDPIDEPPRWMAAA